jgi:hypothetical protein
LAILKQVYGLLFCVFMYSEYWNKTPLKYIIFLSTYSQSYLLLKQFLHKVSIWKKIIPTEFKQSERTTEKVISAGEISNTNFSTPWMLDDSTAHSSHLFLQID